VTRRLLGIAGIVAIGASAVPSVLAQEAMYTAAATMPSPGVSVIREQIHYYRFGGNPNTGADHTDQLEFLTSWQFGLDRGLSLTLDVPIEFRNTVDNDTDDRDKGVRDIDLMLKYRVYQHDTGGIDTFRIALMGGVSFASGDDHDFSSQSANPHLGVVFTEVRGRHGFNQEIHYYFNTGGDEDSNYGNEGPADALRLNASYLFRIAPETYTSDTKGAWYVTAELNYMYETNADHDLRFSPGLMYEGRRFAFEVMSQLPVWQDVDHRPKLVFGIGVGVRFTF
jgi:hypothetical protein